MKYWESYDGNDLGAVYSKESTTFKVWSPGADKAEVKLYATGSDSEKGAGVIGIHKMTAEDNGIFSLKLKGDYNGVYYTYLFTRDDSAIETVDIYGKASGINSGRSMVIDLKNTDPDGWKADKRSEIPENERVIYEVHVRDFSDSSDSGIDEKHKGKFLAFTEKNSTLNNDGIHPTCLSYLKNLGVNYVHLLPFFDYQSVDESTDAYNWGYDPVQYMVPEGSYSTNPYKGDVRIKEVKEMVKSLHEEGIGVVMDVVFNHTFSSDSPFEKTVPGYYYRKKEDGGWSNGSACGNDTASEQPMFRKYIVDAVTYWAEEYHLDGFRFDLMGLHDVETINEVRKALNELPGGENIIMYGEPWKAADTAIAEGAELVSKETLNKLLPGIAIFCDNTRDAIKGSVFEADEPGFVTGDLSCGDILAKAVKGYKAGDKDLKPDSSKRLINYVSAHDNYSLWDKLVLSDSDNIRNKSYEFFKRDEKLIQINKMCAGIYFTLPGTPFLQAGEEGARTKNGVEDSYNSPISINRISWSRMWEYKELADYYVKLINLRKKYSFADTKLFNKTGDKIEFIVNAGKKDEKLFVCYYAGERECETELPKGEWTLISDGKTFNEDISKKYEGRVKLGAKSVSIFSM